MKANTTIQTTLATALALGLLGCGTTIPVETSADNALDELTIGDVVAGFQSFADDGSALVISDELLDSIETLQDQLSAGEITAEAFGDGLLEVIGAGNPRLAFGGFGFFGGPVRQFGGRFGSRGHGDRAAVLGLSDEQQEQTRVIFEALHSDIEALRTTAHDDIRAQLTEDQVALLDERQGERFRSFGGGFGGSRRSGFGRRGPGPRFGSHRDGGAGDDGKAETPPFIDRLTEELGLDDDQVAAITSIRETLRDKISAGHEAAREAFRANLTVEQLAILDELEAQRDDDTEEEATE